MDETTNRSKKQILLKYESGTTVTQRQVELKKQMSFIMKQSLPKILTTAKDEYV